MPGTTSDESRNPKAGLDALLTPDNCALILIDHQPFQFAGLRSHDSQTIINNVVGLAKAAKAFGGPSKAICPCFASTMVARHTYAALPPSSDALESTRAGGDWTSSWTVRAR